MKIKIERANMFPNERILDKYPKLKDFKILEHNSGEVVDTDPISYYGEYLCIEIKSLDELKKLTQKLNRDIIFNNSVCKRGSKFDFEVQIYDDWIE